MKNLCIDIFARLRALGHAVLPVKVRALQVLAEVRNEVWRGAPDFFKLFLSTKWHRAVSHHAFQVTAKRTATAARASMPPRSKAKSPGAKRPAA